LSEDALRKLVAQMGLLLMSTALQLNIVESIAVFCNKIPATNTILALMKERTLALNNHNMT
jgi:hypothetical protein